MVDTHSHIGLRDSDAGEIVRRAAAAGVDRILTVGLEEESNRRAIAVAGEHDAVFASVGRHPNSAAGWDEAARADLLALAERPEVVAIGETGIDYFRNGAPADEQRRAFIDQIAIAREVSKPVVIHVRSGDGPDRDAVSEAFELLEREADGVAVILHCFSAPPERVADAERNGWFCSFAGNATYPKAQALRDAAKLVPDELILVETDSPYLTPQSRRGTPNEPAYVVETAREVAAARGTAYEALERLVEVNAQRVFGWPG